MLDTVSKTAKNYTGITINYKVIQTDIKGKKVFDTFESSIINVKTNAF